MWAELILIDLLQPVRHIQHKQDGSMDWSMWNSTWKKGDGGRGGTMVDIVRAAVEVWLKPAQHVTAQTTWHLQPPQQLHTIDRVECCRQVEQCQHGEIASVKRQENVGESLEDRCLCRTIGLICSLYISKQPRYIGMFRAKEQLIGPATPKNRKIGNRMVGLSSARSMPVFSAAGWCRLPWMQPALCSLTGSSCTAQRGTVQTHQQCSLADESVKDSLYTACLATLERQRQHHRR